LVKEWEIVCNQRQNDKKSNKILKTMDAIAPAVWAIVSFDSCKFFKM